MAMGKMKKIDKKSIIITGILVGMIIFFCILTFILYNKNTILNSENNQLFQERETLSQEKDVLINEREELMIKVQSLDSELLLLKEDVSNIYKSCSSQNACKGHYPGVRWICNNVGDEADEAIASHTCVCDSSCNLSTTEIK